MFRNSLSTAATLVVLCLVTQTVAGLLATQPARAADTERILSFHSDIAIHADSSMTVTETIKVAALGRQIKHGIYRDLPVRYRDADNKFYRVNFHLKEVTLNGVPEPYFVRDVDNNKRIYIGDADVNIPPGEYEYRITYGIQRMLGFFPDHDELYWNVTGTGWEFPIDAASARVTLPEPINADDFILAGYTGESGSTDTAYLAEVTGPATVLFKTTEPLWSLENLTIVIGFPKSIVTPPSAAVQRQWWIADHRSELAGLAGLVLILIYYGLVWVFFGRDPRRRMSWPRETPPASLSPAALRYALRMGSDSTAFSAALLNMAGKGYITLSVDAEGVYTILRGESRQGQLSMEERQLADVLFYDNRESVEVIQDNHGILGEARSALNASLCGQYYNVYFTRNQWGFTGGIVLSILIIGTMAALSHEAVPLIVSLIFTSFLLIAATTVAAVFLSANDQLFSLPWTDEEGQAPDKLPNTVGLAMIIALVSLIPLCIMGAVVSWLLVPIVLGLIVTNCVFCLLLPAYTPLGRRLMDQIGGFRMWLSSPESGRYTAEEGEELTRFERLLPHAVALGIQQEWTEQFEAALEASGRGDASTYQPSWYQNPHLDPGGLQLGDLANSFGNDFSDSLSSASTAPSSSGSGFSGSSGGGGGGGGGGGW